MRSEHRRPDRARVSLHLPRIGIDDPDVLVGVNDEVLRVDVAEDDVERVQVGDLLQERDANIDEVGLGPVGIIFLNRRADDVAWNSFPVPAAWRSRRTRRRCS